MFGVPQAGLTVPAVAGQLERGVRPHIAYAPTGVHSSMSVPSGARTYGHTALFAPKASDLAAPTLWLLLERVSRA